MLKSDELQTATQKKNKYNIIAMIKKKLNEKIKDLILLIK